MRNTNDGSGRDPCLRCDINIGNLSDLPEWSTAPRGSDEQVLSAIKAAGFEGVQGKKPDQCRPLGLGCTGGDRVDALADAERIAAECAAAGYDCVTLHVARGLEDDAEVFQLVEAVLSASEKYDIPLFIETHRATITQDLWRTVQIVKRFPDVRFNGDFSHWYTGAEMVYGDFAAKLDFIGPVLDRVRFVHGRIGDPGAMQVDIGDGKNPQPYGAQPFINHFRELWTRSFAGFLKTAGPGDYICFTPELLPPNIYYARLARQPDGTRREEGDRWQQAQVYAAIAKECFAEAQRRVKAS